MAWIKSCQELRDHPKVYELASCLNEPTVAVIGRLHCLWWWTMSYAPDGDLSRFSPSAIARAMNWEGDAQDFVNALVEVGWIDRTSDGLAVHDWDEHCGDMFAKRIKDAERKRSYRERTSAGQTAENVTEPQEVHTTSSGHPSDIQATSNGHPADVQRMSDVRGEEKRQENIKIVRPLAMAMGERPETDRLIDFETFWAAYPRKIKKKRAVSAWQRLVKAQIPPDLLVHAAAHYAAECTAQGIEERYITYPSRFLNEDQWREHVGGPEDDLRPNISVPSYPVRTVDDITDDEMRELEMELDDIENDGGINVDAREHREPS